MNYTFISLIPKNAGADSLENYRPISLCNFIYKIISKLLADRLQKVIHKIISPNQAAFIKGRSIHHNILLANDLIKDLHSNARGTKICFKADLRKAFDSVNRKFIYKNGLIGFNLSWKLQSFQYSLMAHLLVFLGARMASDKVIHSLRISLLLRWKDLAVCWNT